MFLRRVTSYSNCSIPQSCLARCGASSRSCWVSSAYLCLHSVAGAPPWSAVQRFHPLPPGLPYCVPADVTCGSFCRLFCTSARVSMEQQGQVDRGPPYKRRRRSAEESRGDGVKREQCQLSPNPIRDGEQMRTENWDRVPLCRATSSRSSSPDVSEQDPASDPQLKVQTAGEPGGCSPVRKGPEEEVRGGGTNGRLGLWSQSAGASIPQKQVVGGGSRWSAPCGSVPCVRQQEEVLPARPLQRHWEASSACSAELQPQEGRKVLDFSVLCYNILSQDLLQDNLSLYCHCDPAVLAWEYRLPRLLAEVQCYDADILCLQEVQEDHYETQIRPALQALGYQCEYKRRTGRKLDGCAIAFKSSRFMLRSSIPVEYYRPGDPLLDRDNVGQIVLLQPVHGVDPSSYVCVVNTHLLFNPRRGDIKLAQLAILLAELWRVTHLPDGSTAPVVMCGDLNSTPWSPLYKFLLTGHLQYQGMPIGVVSGQEDPPRGWRPLTAPIWCNSLGINQWCQYESRCLAEAGGGSTTEVTPPTCQLTVEDLAARAVAAYTRSHLQHSLRLQSSYQHLLTTDRRPEVTTCHSRAAMTVDYILYTPGDTGGWSLQQLGRLALVGQKEVEEVQGLPNHHHPSDHLPLLTCFRLLH